jgi:hypothetical protein
MAIEDTPSRDGVSGISGENAIEWREARWA